MSFDLRRAYNRDMLRNEFERVTECPVCHCADVIDAVSFMTTSENAPVTCFHCGHTAPRIEFQREVVRRQRAMQGILRT